jgi:hypothetical protein
MKKTFKILGIIFVIFIVLIIIALILFKIFITPEKVKALIVNQMAKNLNREVEIQDLSVGIFKGISVEGFKVSESPAFKEGTFISSKKFLVRYKLLPLLKKQLSISTVVLEEPYLNIIRKPDGSFNFSDLLESPPADQEKESLSIEKKQAQKIPAFGFLISRAKLKDGEVDFVDYSPEAMSLKVHNVNLDVSGISPVSPMDIKCSASLEHKEASGNLSFNGKLDLDKGILRIEELSPSYHDMSLTIKGYVENLKEKPKLDITLQDKKISTEDISKIFPLPEGIELKGSPHFKIDISGSTDNVLIKTDANMEDISIKYRNTFEKKRGMKCGLKFEAEVKDNESLDLKQSLIYLADFNISASGQIKGLKSLPLTLDITIQTKESDLKDLAKFLPFIKDINLSGKLAAMFDINGAPPEKLDFASELSLDNINFLFNNHEIKSLNAHKIKLSNTELGIPEMKGIWNEAEFFLSCKAKEFSLQKFTSPYLSFDLRLSRLDIDRILLPLPPPKEEKKKGPETAKPYSPSSLVDEIIKGIKIDGGLKIDQIVYQDFKLSKADVIINMRQGKLEVKPLSIEGYEGKLSGELQADLKRINDVQFTNNINLKNLNCNPAIRDLHPQRMARIHGKASFESILSGKSSKIPDSMEGNGYLKIENGKIESTMPLIGQFMALLGKPQPEAIFFSELKGHYRLKDKKIITEDLQMIGDDVSFDAQGWAGLDKNLHFDVTARLNEKMLGKEIRKHIVRDKQGRSLLFLIVKGNMNKPDIHPDLKKTLAEQAKQKAKDSVLEKVIGEKDGELRKTIEKGLNQLFKFKK